MIRCDKTDLLVDQCAHCRRLLDPGDEARQQRKALISTGEWIEAKWRGKCVRCGEWFPEGAAIRPAEDRLGWIAECCGDDVDGAA